ncbi:PAS domain-containing protein [Flavobacterium sp. GT2N3]|uniref:PAS domain-containing protein n=1 Tax=unclassified Flavobacterium TaxID=196869 RepID=UPI003AAF535E
MNNFRQYDEAIAKYHSSLNVKTVPVTSWNFHNDFLGLIKNIFVDVNKLGVLASQSKWIHNNWDLKTRLREEVIILTDTKLNIVFASYNMIKMNGYVESEVLGKNPKIFQGKSTDLAISNEIRTAISLQQPFEKTVMNYKKNGDVYVCLIKGFPIFNRKGKLSHYIAFEKAA